MLDLGRSLIKCEEVMVNPLGLNGEIAGFYQQGLPVEGHQNIVARPLATVQDRVLWAQIGWLQNHFLKGVFVSRENLQSMIQQVMPRVVVLQGSSHSPPPLPTIVEMAKITNPFSPYQISAGEDRSMHLLAGNSFTLVTPVMPSNLALSGFSLRANDVVLQLESPFGWRKESFNVEESAQTASLAKNFFSKKSYDEFYSYKSF